ncbi:Hsp20/alpha crystallin family protein [Flavobacterium sp. SUN052]|uniref:Hsp20/alpha crystallin family protein n=1 Tax=Flavobacterium sp. SUN052 TaxID=3002441 RepID=UPI00237EDE63|nr:Hsp20/alpha crystallin family protein [Flavobacterium sp. SUN052]MEC4005759.1 Hsp20/alpha crystallin family protein [Flavobacterium sp. SUN052]
MNLIKRNPSLILPSVFDELFSPDFFGGVQNFSNNVPSVNIKENETNFEIELASPGLSKEDFNIEVDNNVLSISTETKSENEEHNAKYTRKEFSFSAFKRSFTLPESVNSESINAIYENGILNIKLPKKEEALPKPKRLIEIC